MKNPDLTSGYENLPDKMVAVRDLFGIDSDMQVPMFSLASEYVPEVDDSYRFDPDTTLAILAGFAYNSRVMVQGYHGSGKTTHIEQVAARLNWGCVRVNLDSYISRVDLIGRDAIVLKDGQQVTEFQQGILPWSLQTPTALVFDEYDAGRPDVMFVIQRVLEAEGRLTLLDQNRIIQPHPAFRLFATSNTIGLGDTTGLYHGTQQINQGQLDRWNIIATLNYLPHDQELEIALAKAPGYQTEEGSVLLSKMVQVANLTRQGFMGGDLSTVMSLRTVINWSRNTEIFGDVSYAFKVTFLNRCDELERPLVAEYFERCFGEDPGQGPDPKPVEEPPDYEEGEPGADQGDGADEEGGDEGPESLDSGSGKFGDEEDDEEESLEHGDVDSEGGKIIPFPQAGNDDISEHASDLTEGIPQEPDFADFDLKSASAYHVYTTRFDEVVHARDLVSQDQKKHLRVQLDREISGHRRTAVKLANRLQNSLKTLQKRAWTFDLDDGVLNTTRLSRLIIDPANPLAYKQEHEDKTRDTVVSFLIDNSGSMRGQPIALAAMFTDILAQALERCHVSTEILGFTTRQWRGGQTAQSWRKKNKPNSPGRLSDLRHVIYKTADESWRKARQSLGVMLWPDLLKENIDGEALLWAHQRLTGRQEQRRILVVISDGVPADDATLTANSSGYLEAHLREVVDWIETRSSVELLAIGIGHDVNAIYQRSVTIADSEQLGDAMAHELIELLGNVPATARQPFAINY
jgi:cobaltochelatase CobS